MPRPYAGPRLVLYGPDTRHGARIKRGFREYRWYICWREGGKKRELATGLVHGRCSQAERDEALAAFLAARERPAVGPRGPDETLIADILEMYGREHGPHTAAPERIGYAIDALLPFWGERPVVDITKETCRRYVVQRMSQPRRRPKETKADLADAEVARISQATARRELDVLEAALNYCVAEGALTVGRPVWKPEKMPRRERWLTRQEAARLLAAARRNRAARWHLPLFILLGLYTGARRGAILQLQWQPNMLGGHIDLDRRLIVFNALDRAQTNKRRPTIPIPDRLYPALVRARRRTRQYVIEHHGRPVEKLRRSFQTAVTEAGLDGHVTAHTLCHTAITWMVQAGVNFWQISGWTGRSSRMIEDVYGHHAPDFLAEAKAAADRRR